MNIVLRYKDDHDLVQQLFIPDCEFHYISFAGSQTPKDYVVIDLNTVLDEQVKLRKKT